VKATSVCLLQASLHLHGCASFAKEAAVHSIRRAPFAKGDPVTSIIGAPNA